MKSDTGVMNEIEIFAQKIDIFADEQRPPADEALLCKLGFTDWTLAEVKV